MANGIPILNKILHIIPSLNKGGAERLVINICSELSKQEKMEVCLVTFRDDNEYNDIQMSFEWKVIPSHFTPSISKKSSSQIQDLQDFIVDFKPTIIHSHLWEAEIVTRQITYSDAKWFSHFHDNMPQLNKVFFPTSKIALTNAFERSLMLKKYKTCKNNFIAISQDAYTYAQRVLPLSLKKRTTKLLNAIDVAQFIKPDSFIPDNTCLNLVTVGSLVDKKNHIFLISVVENIIKNGTDCMLHVLGDGSNRDMLQYEIVERRLENNIILHGNTQVQDYYWNADVYVHAATYEPFGLVLLEAMAAGLPVVCLDGGGNRDIIENGVNGYILNDNNIEEFSDTILRVYNNEAERDRLISNSAKFVENFSISLYVEKLKKIYSISK